MRLMQLEASTFLVCKKGLEAEALLIPVTRLLRCREIADQIQGLLISLGPPTQHHTRTIHLTGDIDLFSLHEPPRLETRAERIEAKGRALPRRYRAHGRAAGI